MAQFHNPQLMRTLGGFPDVFGTSSPQGECRGRYLRTDGHRRLWRSVLEQALRDALMIDGNPTGNPNRDLVHYAVKRRYLPPTRDRALFWLLYDRHDYAEVCDMASVDGRRLREWLNVFLRRHGVIQTAT